MPGGDAIGIVEERQFLPGVVGEADHRLGLAKPEMRCEPFERGDGGGAPPRIRGLDDQEEIGVDRSDRRRRGLRQVGLGLEPRPPRRRAL